MLPYGAEGWGSVSGVTQGLLGAQEQLELTSFAPQKTSCGLSEPLGGALLSHLGGAPSAQNGPSQPSQGGLPPAELLSVPTPLALTARLQGEDPGCPQTWAMTPAACPLKARAASKAGLPPGRKSFHVGLSLGDDVGHSACAVPSPMEVSPPGTSGGAQASSWLSGGKPTAVGWAPSSCCVRLPYSALLSAGAPGLPRPGSQKPHPALAAGRSLPPPFLPIPLLK